jgi:DNA-binding XRE family transcriptional regulator
LYVKKTKKMNTSNFKEICPRKAEILTKETIKIIGNNVKKLRRENNLTQSVVAFYIGSDKSLISNLETGYIDNLTLFSISKLVTLFNITIEELLKNET